MDRALRRPEHHNAGCHDHEGGHYTACGGRPGYSSFRTNTYPDIQECVVLGMPDKEWGESVTAFILPKPGLTIDERGVIDFSKARMSAYKVPKRVITVDDFPRTPAGKVLKRELRESFLKGDDST